MLLLTASGRSCLQVLKELGWKDAPMLTEWNKIDACSDATLVSQVTSQRTDTSAISAAIGEGLNTLRGALEGMLYAQLHHVHCLVPYSQVRAHERAIHARVYAAGFVHGLLARYWSMDQWGCLHVCMLCASESYLHGQCWMWNSGITECW